MMDAVNPPPGPKAAADIGKGGAQTMRGAQGNANDVGPPVYVHGSEFALWDKYEQIAMHFNDLIMRLRTQALGGLAGLVAISGVAINLTPKTESKLEWEILFGTICFFAVAWVALWWLDLGYYTRLLMGAVKAIEDHERRTPVVLNDQGLPELYDEVQGLEKEHVRRINISCIISAKARHYWWVVFGFYSFVFIALAAGGAYSYSQMHVQTNRAARIPEYKVDIAADHGIDVRFEQTPRPQAPGSAKSGR